MPIFVMLVAVVVVCGAMFATLILFFRRLRRIEESFLGRQPHIPWRARYQALLFRLRHHIRKS